MVERKYQLALESIRNSYGGEEARIASGYQLDSQSIFSQLSRPLFTGGMCESQLPSLEMLQHKPGMPNTFDSFWKIILEQRRFETANSRDGILP